jgi:hypothetical protein
MRLRAPSRVACVALGFALGAASLGVAQVTATVNTNGVLKGYIVQKDGKVVCRDPSVWLQFRGPKSYIVCD